MLSSRLLLIVILIICSPLLATAEDAESRARRLMNALGCKACHSFEQSGSILAPSLNRVGARLTLQQLQEKLTAHRKSKSNSLMPSYATTPAEDLNAILQFLSEHK
ncbi:MAG TPA: c-type cytochrome [Geopsychrobacteraceae bacterium]|nr:c-type cytochrome [Geopsychrobacteraceae bacterium]